MKHPPWPFFNLIEFRYGKRCLVLPSCYRPVLVGAEPAVGDGVPFLSPGISNISGLLLETYQKSGGTSALLLFAAWLVVLDWKYVSQWDILHHISLQ